MLVLAIVLGVKYILFDHDDSDPSSDESAAISAVSAATADKLDTSIVVNGCISGGPLHKIDEVAEETLHSEMSDDSLHTSSSLPGDLILIFHCCLLAPGSGLVEYPDYFNEFPGQMS